ncbi:hypothetical protein K1719_043718 [Acacia pycnantha]|nr:hypothetical protein K1719_043718 [Acacia pycnantha]
MAFNVIENAATASHRSFTVNYDGTSISVTLANTAAAVARWISETKPLQVQFPGKFVVGLGVQWTPGYRAPADTLQLCVGKRCLVYQLCHPGNVPGSLRRFLMDPGNTFVGFWNNRDRRKLEISTRGLEMFRNPLDMRKYVKTDDGENLGRLPSRGLWKNILAFRSANRPTDQYEPLG